MKPLYAPLIVAAVMVSIVVLYRSTPAHRAAVVRVGRRVLAAGAVLVALAVGVRLAAGDGGGADALLGIAIAVTAVGLVALVATAVARLVDRPFPSDRP